MTESTEVHEGGCLCGAVRYRITGPVRGVVNCHCGQCVRTHGLYAAYSNAASADMDLTGADAISWYQSSAQARRGFCGTCGSQLFWERTGSETISVAAGTFDQPSGIKTVGHIYMADKPDFYEIDDDLPKFPGTSDGDLDGEQSL